MKFPLVLDTLAHLLTEEQAAVFAAIIEALVEVNRIYLTRHPAAADMLSRVTYEPDHDDAAWKDILGILRTGKGSCHDLVAARIAVHRNAGRDARVHVVYYRGSSVDTFHLQVMVNGKIEDPAKEAGMLSYAYA